MATNDELILGGLGQVSQKLGDYEEKNKPMSQAQRRTMEIYNELISGKSPQEIATRHKLEDAGHLPVGGGQLQPQPQQPPTPPLGTMAPQAMPGGNPYGALPGLSGNSLGSYAQAPTPRQSMSSYGRAEEAFSGQPYNPGPAEGQQSYVPQDQRMTGLSQPVTSPRPQVSQGLDAYKTNEDYRTFMDAVPGMTSLRRADNQLSLSDRLAIEALRGHNRMDVEEFKEPGRASRNENTASATRYAADANAGSRTGAASITANQSNTNNQRTTDTQRDIAANKESGLMVRFREAKTPAEKKSAFRALSEDVHKTEMEIVHYRTSLNSGDPGVQDKINELEASLGLKKMDVQTAKDEMMPATGAGPAARVGPQMQGGGASAPAAAAPQVAEPPPPAATTPHPVGKRITLKSPVKLQDGTTWPAGSIIEKGPDGKAHLVTQ